MIIRDWKKEENENAKERYELSIARIREIQQEETVEKRYLSYFYKVADFLLCIHEVKEQLESGEWNGLSIQEMQTINHNLYRDVLPQNYDVSYVNPAYAAAELGEKMGRLLSFLYTEIRGTIAYVYESRLLYLTICNELFIEVYNAFEGCSPEPESIREILYWYASDYCDVFLADRIKEQINPEYSFATDYLAAIDISDERYLYGFGEYISENELETAKHLMELSEETITKMADVYTEGYRMGFVNGGKSLEHKAVVNIRYNLGFERVVLRSIENFKAMGLTPTIYRAAVSVMTKKQQIKIGYYGAIANKQYEYDHRADQGLILDKKYMERKLDVMKNVYEKNKELAAAFAGPAVMEVFGEEPFVPVNKKEAVALDEKQEKLSLLYDSKAGQLTNQYIKGEERSFTIIAYPLPEIGENYKEIFDEVIRINTLDAKVYENIQQNIIDALDQGEYVHVLGTKDNGTDLKIQLYKLQNKSKETIFENCVADVNIPVGEVFTSPVLEGTNGVLCVSKVYLNELQYKNLKIAFENGRISDYTCSNFEDEGDCKRYIKENVLHNHDTLPLGEFAIGTNTTAYVVARKYHIEDKMPILIAEKMGPHFAVGDTCYSWSEDNKIYNPNGKEIVAKDNSVSILRKEDVSQAYFQCHTDITIPYEELASITVYDAKGNGTVILQDGRFILEGTEELNKPFINENNMIY